MQFSLWNLMIALKLYHLLYWNNPVSSRILSRQEIFRNGSTGTNSLPCYQDGQAIDIVDHRSNNPELWGLWIYLYDLFHACRRIYSTAKAFLSVLMIGERCIWTRKWALHVKYFWDWFKLYNPLSLGKRSASIYISNIGCKKGQYSINFWDISPEVVVFAF